MSMPHILVVDDEPEIRNLVQEILEDEGYSVDAADGGDAARKSVRERRPDLVLLDIWMPDVDGISLLKEWSDDGELPFPVIMMSGHGTVETAVEATRLGAYDFIEKPLSLAKLLLTVQHAVEADRLKRENVDLMAQAQPIQEPVGKSRVMQDLREQIRRIATHDTPVLITGEAGAGKKTCARYLHTLSHRADGPFVEMAVATVAAGNSARELFGSEEGGSVHYGLLEQANGGTLFLEEVADMDLETQARLSSAMEAKSFLRVSGSEQVSVNVRIVASTHQLLDQLVQSGDFREDLFYQLTVVPLAVPALREHREDVLELLNYYVDYFVMHEGLKYRRFPVAVQNRLRNYPWPGNIRELKNLVQRLLILGSEDEVDISEVDNYLSARSDTVQSGTSSLYDLPLREAREQFEREYLQHQLAMSEGSVGKLSKLVGMERTNLYRKLRALGIDVKQGK
jgi:DNA-binding NtrC family response regulator